MSVSEQRAAVLPLPPPQPHRQEAAGGGGGGAARMPAWKREILERRKAKQASPADSRSWIPGRAASHSNRAGEVDRERGEAAAAAAPAGETEAGAVLLESIAPIQENPFIQRERRRRRQRQLAERQAPAGGSAKPVQQQLLELYSHMPGVRTIQADNIIIIESDPDYFAEAGPAPRLHAVGELLSRAGQGGVAEIRAAEVLVYQGALSRSEENLSTLSAEEPLLHGKVSRLLQKFDRNYAKPSRSRSTENLLDGFSPSPGRHTKPLLLPKPASAGRREEQAGAAGPPAPGTPLSPAPGTPLSPAPRTPLSPAPGTPLSPSQPRPSPGSSPTKAPGPLFPGRAPCAPAAAAAAPRHGPREASAGEEGRPFSVSSYRKQFENVPADARQHRHKELPPWEAPRDNEKDWATTKEDSKPVENGHQDSVKTSSFPVPEGEMDNAARLDDTGSGRIPHSANASSKELSKGASTWRPEPVLTQKKASESSPEPPQPAADSCSRPSSAQPSATPPGKVSQNHSVEGSAKVTPNQCNGVSASTSLNNSFDIVPAKPPDFSSIPEGDVQARALANLKKQSRNSFVVIPKKRVDAPVESSEVCEDNGETNKSCEKPKIENGASTPEAETSRISAVSSELVSPSDRQSQEGKLPAEPPPLPKEDFKPKVEETMKKRTSSGSYDVFSRHTNNQFSFGKETSVLPTEMSEAERNAESTVVITKIRSLSEDLPITNIDDVVVTDEKETSKQRPRASPAVAKDKPSEGSFGGPQHSFVQRKSGNTFTVVPQRKPAVKDQQPSVNANEISQENGTDEQSAEDSETSLAKLGVLLKKRYPLAEDIQVIGGYLSLERSCLSKAGSTRKKMKISFNDSSLHTTFEYPSENSLIQEGASEESDNDEEGQPSTFFFPRPNYTSSPTTTPSSPLRTNTLASAFTNYTPKHTVSFNTWQEQKLDESVSEKDSSQQDTESTIEDDMLTPADSSKRSDYSSEPALYF